MSGSPSIGRSLEPDSTGINVQGQSSHVQGQSHATKIHESDIKTDDVGQNVFHSSPFISEKDIQQDISKEFHNIKEWVKSLNPFASASPLTTMAKIGNVAKEFFSSLFDNISQKWIDYNSDPIQQRVEYYDVSTNPGKLQTYVPHSHNAAEFLSIPDPTSQLVDLQHTKGSLNHKDVATYAANTAKLHEKVADKEIEGVGTLEPFCFETGSAVKGAVTPTSYLLGVDDKKAKNHLMNVYVVKVGDTPVAQIRSGVIDTKEKADEFVALINKLHAEFSSTQGATLPPLRVVSHQLNSFDFKTEDKMINKQHRWIAYANKNLKGTADLVHINSPCNRFYHTTKLVRKGFESIGLGSVANFIEDHFLTGERLSKEQNLDSWATYTKWVAEDVDKAFNADPSLSANKELSRAAENFQKEMKGLNDGISTLKNEIDDLLEKTFSAGEEGKDSKKEVQEKRDQIRGLLIKQYEAIDTFKEVAEDKASLAVLQPLELMHTVLQSQLDISTPKKPSRGQELMSIQLLSQILGVTVAINCKSGLDRTGLAFIVKVSLLQMDQIPSSNKMSTDSFSMVRDWDQVTLALNKKMAEGVEEFNRWIQTEEGLSDDSGTIEMDQVRQVIEFRKMMLDNLIQIGLPITKTSTGLEGLKWSPGAIEENLIPLNFLPSHVMVGDELLPLVNYDSQTGEPTGIAPTGQQLLTKFSALRGS